MIIQRNQSALNAWRHAKTNNGSASKNLEKLSSGLKVNRSADDAASLAISEKMRGQVRGLAQAQKNLKDGMSFAKTIDGAMSIDHEMLQRIRELLVQASNGTYAEDDRLLIQKEINGLMQEIDQLSYRAQFNKIRVLRADSAEFPDWIYMDVDANGNLLGQMVNGGYTPAGQGGASYPAARIDFSDLNGYNVQELCNTGFSFTCCTCTARVVLRFNDKGNNSYEPDPNAISILNVDITGIENGEDLVKRVMNVAYSTNALPQGGAATAGFNGHFTRFAVDPDNPNVLIAHDNRDNQTGKPGQVRTEDKSFVEDPNIKIQAGANQNETINILIKTVDLLTLGMRIKHGDNLIDTSSTESTMAAIDIVDNAINILSGMRADIGAVQNRMEHALNNVGVQAENLQAAESSIRDVDMAKEMMEFVKNNILVQASQSMLAQANQLPQGIMGLLR